MKFVIIFTVVTIVITSIVIMITAFKERDTRKKFSPKIIIAMGAMIIGISIINDNKTEKVSNTYVENNNIIPYEENRNIRKIGNEFVQYNIEQNEVIKKRTETVTQYCNGKKECEIEQIFKYVTEKPYVLGNSKVKKPNEVIEYGGDCDEKTYLFASMLKEKGHKCVIVYTKDHAFAAVEIKDIAYLYRHTASLKINGKYYFYAETTAKGSFIGWYNQTRPENFKSVYDVNEDREIALNDIELNLN